MPGHERHRSAVLARWLQLAEERCTLADADADGAALLYEQVFDADPADEEDLEAVGATAALIPRRALTYRVVRRIARDAVEAPSQRPRIWKYRVLSTCPRVSGGPIILQPVPFVGPGDGVQFGWRNSQLFSAGCCYIEAARPHARIEIGDRTEFNNSVMIKKESAGIRLGRDGLFGAHTEIFDSGPRDLDPARRRDGKHRMAPVEIGDDCVIGAGAVVSSDLPAGVVAAGSPARVVRDLG